MSDQKQKIYIDPNKAASTTTEIDWGEGEYVRILSTLFGNDTDAIIFNMEYIEKYNPEFAKKLQNINSKN